MKTFHCEVCGVEGRQKLLNNLAVELLLQHPREFLGTVLKEKINYRRLNFLLFIQLGLSEETMGACLKRNSFNVFVH